jgi:hypothetical protein
VDWQRAGIFIEDSVVYSTMSGKDRHSLEFRRHYQDFEMGFAAETKSMYIVMPEESRR